MKILSTTPWNNTWIPYWTKYIESRGHEVKWQTSEKIQVKAQEFIDKVEWCDAVLCHWADKYAMWFSHEIDKPLYVILRSYEIFSADGWSDLGQINWKKIRQLFMLNEAHYHPFSCRVEGVRPVFIKNGVDIDEWKADDTPKNNNRIAWICDINEKKGVELVVQAFHELRKIAPAVTLEHIGRNQDLRRWYYLEQVMPHLNTKWFNTGFKNSHDFVKNFLKDKGFIISTSIAEGNPMNIIEAMALGIVPLVHNWPGADIQFPKKYIWTTFDDLKDIYKRECESYSGAEARQWVEEHYDYRKNFKPVIDIMEQG